AMLGHELRNPLAAIRNAILLLQVQAKEGDQLRQAQSIIEREVGQLVRLVDDLLDVSRITQGKIRLHMEAVDLTEIVNEAVELSGPLIKARRHRLHLSVPEAAVRVMGDAARLAQVLANLLHNAAKYTDEGGEIW